MDVKLLVVVETQTRDVLFSHTAHVSSFLLIEALTVINFPLNTALAASQKFCYVLFSFLFHSVFFLIPLSLCLSPMDV